MLLKSFFGYIKRFIVVIVRIFERALTGQSDFQFYSSEIADFDAVTDLLHAKMLRREVENYLNKTFGITIQKPVVLELYSGASFDLRGIIMELNGNLGRYHYDRLKNREMIHLVYLKKGLPRERFKAVLAHEMIHAFCREQDIMPTDRYGREGLARWVEHRILKDMGQKAEARKIEKIRTWKYGRAVQNMFALEKKVGTSGVVEYLKKQ